MGVRLYDPTTGRFLTVDPVPGGSSANAYDYRNSDTHNHYDLAGRWWWGTVIGGMRDNMSVTGGDATAWCVTPIMLSGAGAAACRAITTSDRARGGAEGGATLTYGWWAGPVDRAAAGFNGAFGSAAGMGSYRWG